MPVTGTTEGRADVELRLAADSAYAAVIRTTSAGLAARLDFTIDDIEDLRMAVGEAHALALEHAEPGSDLTFGFWLGAGRIVLTVEAVVEGTPEVDQDSFAWQVLTTLAESADLAVVDTTLRIRLAVHSSTLDPTLDPAPDRGAGPGAG